MPAKRLGRLGRLSCGESLLIARRRQEGRETQHDASWRCGTTLRTYGMWERGMISPLPPCKLGRIKPHEKCLIYRRRVMMSQGDVALKLGRSRWWINQMERGVVPCAELLSYWEK